MWTSSRDGGDGVGPDAMDALRENRTLRERVHLLEKENANMRKAILHLNTLYLSDSRSNSSRPSAPFDIDAALAANTINSGDGSDDGLPRMSAMEGTRQYTMQGELKGHQGAVYVAEFSPCGRFLASGSFDKTARVWDHMQHKELFSFTDHSLIVADLDWFPSSDRIVTGSYDKSIRVFQMDAPSSSLFTRDLKGFVQCVACLDPNTVLAGTSRKEIHLLDLRVGGNSGGGSAASTVASSTSSTSTLPPSSALQPLPSSASPSIGAAGTSDSSGSPIVIENDGMINSLVPHRHDPFYITTGDSLGAIKTWDTRTGKCVVEYVNDDRRKPIAHIALSRHARDEEPRFMGVTCFDNVLRVYNRGAIPSQTTPQLICGLTGGIVKNWPIRCAFAMPSDEHSSKVLGLDSVASARDPDTGRRSQPLLMASGSASNDVFLYQVEPEANNGELMQQLRGHTGRVYCVDFHPTQHLLASSSTDSTVRIWNAKGKRQALP